jgi:hypothetical protein
MLNANEPAARRSDPPTRPLVAIVPVGTLAGAKSRLGAVLDAEEREELALRLARTTIEAVVAARRIDETLVVTPTTRSAPWPSRSARGPSGSARAG